MKAVTGTAVSSKPISLSKAASTLSSFLSADNGASQAICSYLRRASASFNDLKQLHKDRRPLKYGKTALPSELKAEVESSVAAIEKKKKNKKHKRKSENEDEPDGKSEISSDNGQIEATEDLVENNESLGDEKDKDNDDGRDLVEMSTTRKKKKKTMEEDANSGGAIEKMLVSDSKEKKRKGNL